jgi:hypothetical protein
MNEVHSLKLPSTVRNDNFGNRKFEHVDEEELIELGLDAGALLPESTVHMPRQFRQMPRKIPSVFVVRLPNRIRVEWRRRQ